MKVDIVAGLESLKVEMSRYANSLCKALGLSVGEVDEIVQRTMVDIWKISQRDGRKTVYDKRRSTVKPSFEDTYEGNIEYKKWVMGCLKLTAKVLKLEENKQVKTVSLKTMENYLSYDSMPAKPSSIPKYDWE